MIDNQSRSVIKLVFLWHPFCKIAMKINGWNLTETWKENLEKRCLPECTFLPECASKFLNKDRKKKSAYSSVADFLYFPACLQISLETLTTTFAQLCKWNSVRRHKLLQLVQSKIADGSSMDVFALLNSFLVFFPPSLHFNNLFLIFFFFHSTEGSTTSVNFPWKISQIPLFLGMCTERTAEIPG